MADFRHLLRLCDGVGVLEHAAGAEPLPEHGYCTDDVGRALVVAAREPNPSGAVSGLAAVCVRYLAGADRGNGIFRNRKSTSGRWQDDGASDDASGRAVWGIGTAYARGGASLRQAVGPLVASGMRFRSPYPRATAVAVLGAFEVLLVDPTHVGARALIRDALATLPRPDPAAAWPWPEPRLTYANALLPDALTTAAWSLPDTATVGKGLAWLDSLLSTQRVDDHFSFTPTNGWYSGEPRPAFDQQPIEAATTADACWRAWKFTGDERWAAEAARSIGWFRGVNDTEIALRVNATGGCTDGLTATGRNENQGAESTISLILADQLAERLRGALGATFGWEWLDGQAARSTPSSSLNKAASDTSHAPTARSAAPYVR